MEPLITAEREIQRLKAQRDEENAKRQELAEQLKAEREVTVRLSGAIGAAHAELNEAKADAARYLADLDAALRANAELKANLAKTADDLDGMEAQEQAVYSLYEQANRQRERLAEALRVLAPVALEAMGVR